MTVDRLPSISRRRVLSLTGATLAGGAVVAFGGSGTAQAQATVNDLQLSGGTHEGEDGTVSNVSIEVSGSWQYTTDAADEYLITLMVASAPDADDWEPIDQLQEYAMAPSTAGTYSLSGSILDHPALEASMFSADPAETVTREVPVAVTLDVLYGGEVAVSAIAQTTAQIEVTSTAVQVSAEVTGNGQIDVAV